MQLGAAMHIPVEQWHLLHTDSTRMLGNLVKVTSFITWQTLQMKVGSWHICLLSQKVLH